MPVGGVADLLLACITGWLPSEYIVRLCFQPRQRTTCTHYTSSMHTELLTAVSYASYVCGVCVLLPCGVAVCCVQGTMVSKWIIRMD